MCGEATGNLEFAGQGGAANERLFHPRLAEAMIFSDLLRGLHNLVNVGGDIGQKNARLRVVANHRRRIERASQIEILLSSNTIRI
jgi:hypothetical protein